MFGILAIAVTARVTGSTRESMLTTLPVNVRVGYTAPFAAIVMPTSSSERKFSGT